MTEHIGDMIPPPRLMLTPGPSSVDPRVYRAMSTPLVGHLDPWFHEFMTDVQVLLRRIFQTENRTTFPISASGSGGIEASVVNPLEPGDEAIICVNGTFSERMAIIAERTGAKITRVEAPYGKPVDLGDVRRAGKGKKIKMLGVTHGESSTSVMHNLDAFRKVADELDTMLVVDMVSTLGGTPIHTDKQRLDLAFSGSQKALSCPPGLSPITVSPRMEELLRARKTPVQSWYFDLTTTMNFWGKERTYHHTAPISLIFGLREAMRIVLEEGLEPRWARHRENQQALIAGLEAMGIHPFVQNPADRMITVTGISVPAGIDEVKVRRQLISEFNIEIAGGFGPLKGKLWRVGLMGHTSQRANVLLFLGAFEKALLDQGFKMPAGAGVGAAVRSFAQVQEAVAVK